MPDFFNGKRKPEPGRPANVVRQSVVNVQNNIDTNAIADAVIKAIEKKMPMVGRVIEGKGAVIDDGFDNSESLDKLADVMTTERKNESNFEDLGNIKVVKKDINETNKTIDLLSGLED